MDEEDWLTCEDPDYLLPYLTDEVRVAERKLRLFACACCGRVSRFVDPSLVTLLRLAERFADGQVDVLELAAAHDSARRRFGTWDSNNPHYRPHEAATEAFILAAEISPDSANHRRNCLVPFAQESSALAAIALEHDSRDHEAMVKESAIQCELLRDIFGNLFRPATFDPAWHTSDVMALATSMYESRDYAAMPILADALQDAGCDCDDILNHLRDPHATHVRGCWALDLVLGKE